MDFRIKKILIADDSQIFLMYIGILLKRMGFKIIPAKTGVEVLKLLKIVEPDVVMLDVRIGEIDGTTLLKYIKDDRQVSHIPVIMVSSDSSIELIEKCRDLGCASYLTKPIKIDKLHEALEGCIFSQMGTKRKHLRVSINKKVIVSQNGIQSELYTETLSEGGMYIRKKDPFPVGSEVEVILPLNDGGSIRLPGVVIFKKELFGDVFKMPPGMGIKFKNVPDEELKILKNYIETLFARDILDSQEEIIIDI